MVETLTLKSTPCSAASFFTKGLAKRRSVLLKVGTEDNGEDCTGGAVAMDDEVGIGGIAEGGID